MTGKVLRRFVAVVTMGLGIAGVFTLLYSMNELTKPPDPDPPKAAIDFGPPPPPPKKPPPPPKPKPQKHRVAQVSRAAPPPSITTALSGLSFDLPQFEASDALGTDKLLSAADNKKLVMTEDSVDSLPRPLARKSPEYPTKARARGIEGHVTLKIKVSERGDVEQIRVVEATPAGVFEEVAVNAVREWRFEPAQYKGTPVAVAVSQKIPFRLN